MFDIGFWELTLIGVVALLVVGPERLPSMARTVGLYAGKMRRWVTQVRGEVERELRADEIRQAMRDAERNETLKSVSEAARMDDVKEVFRSAGDAIKEAAAELDADVKTPPVDATQSDEVPPAVTESLAADPPPESPAPATESPAPAAGPSVVETPAAAEGDEKNERGAG